MQILVQMLILLVCLSGSSYAQSLQRIPNEDTLGFVKFVSIVLVDNVKGDCWRNSEVIKNNLILKFEQNGIEFMDYVPQYTTVAAPQVFINAFGNRFSKICAVNGQISVGFGNYVNLDTRHTERNPLVNNYIFGVTSYIFDTDAIFVSGGSVDADIKEFFDGASSELIAKIISGRRSESVKAAQSEFPYLLVKPPREEQ